MKKKLVFALFFIAAARLSSAQVKEGMKAFDREKFQTAATLFKQAIAANAADVSAWYWLQRAYYATDQPDSAALLVNRFPQAQQETPLYHVIKGTADLHSGDTVSAYNQFNAALGNGRKKDPSVQLAIARSVTDADKGNYYYAISLLEKAMSRNGKDPELYLAAGDAYRKLYNGSESFRNYNQAIQLDKNNAVAYYKIGKIFQTQQNEDVYNEYYQKALAADPGFAPVYYQQYFAAYFKDARKALEPLVKYISLADNDVKHHYLLGDLYFILKKYPEAISEAKLVQDLEKGKMNPRVLKLMAYSYEGMKDTALAEQQLTRYFEVAADSAIAPADQLLMARLLERKGQDSIASVWRREAFAREKDSTAKIAQVREMIAIAKSKKKYAQQSDWYDELDRLHASMNNVDLFNWGVADFNAKRYASADSVFARYEEKYPEQTYGYYWRARSNAAIDTSMELGLAVPHWENLIRVATKDTADANNRRWLIQAYGYVAAYKVNTQKEYEEAMEYYDRILQLDPSNAEASKYKDVLARMIERQDKEQDQGDPKEKTTPPGN